MFVLTWKGQAIPNCGTPLGTRNAIYAMEPDPALADMLWTLWCSTDALVVGDEQLFLDNAMGELLGCIEDKDFLENGDPSFKRLPGFIRGYHPGDLELEVTAA